jgi:hypothetical protein
MGQETPLRDNWIFYCSYLFYESGLYLKHESCGRSIKAGEDQLGAGYAAHPFSKKSVYTPIFAGAIRLLRPSYQALAAWRKVMVVQITRAFPPVTQVRSTLCPGVTDFHLLYFYVSVRRCSPVLGAQLVTTDPDIESGSKHDWHPSHDR